MISAVRPGFCCVYATPQGRVLRGRSCSTRSPLPRRHHTPASVKEKDGEMKVLSTIEYSKYFTEALNKYGLSGTSLAVAQAGAVLLFLGFVDAGYSGDWSRIGVISTDTETLLQKVVIVIAILHFGIGLLTARVAIDQGDSWIVPFIKGFAFGTLGLYEVAVVKKKSAP